MENKKISDVAIKWLENTTISPDKIANQLGFYGDKKKHFLIFAKEYRLKLWNNQSADVKENT